MGLFSRKKAAPEPEAEEKPVKEDKKIDEEAAQKPKQDKPKAEVKPAPVEDEAAEPKSNGAYFVSPHPDGGWQVKKAKAQKALKKFKTKAEAEAYAKQVAEHQGTNVVRQKKDGKFQKKH